MGRSFPLGKLANSISLEVACQKGGIEIPPMGEINEDLFPPFGRLYFEKCCSSLAAKLRIILSLMGWHDKLKLIDLPDGKKDS